MLRKVLEDGSPRRDRTGVGTHALFGERIKGPIGVDFPLLTTKKIHWKSVVEELFWMISGSTNAKDLSNKGVHIWDAWADPITGALGPIYGHCWRNYGGKIKQIKQPKPKLRAGLLPTFLGVANGKGNFNHVVGKTWEAMIRRCYQPSDKSYVKYGLRGVHVCDDWLEFEKFAEDVKLLPNWHLKEQTPHLYQIDKDGIGNGFRYANGYCQWVTPEQNNSYNLTTEYTVSREGTEYTFTNAAAFCREQGRDWSDLGKLLTSGQVGKTLRGYTFVKSRDLTLGVDQLANAIELIKYNPYDRRIAVSSWNPAEIELAALPPCHHHFQFYAETIHHPDCADYMSKGNRCVCDNPRMSGPQNKYPKKYLDCMVTMRSCDVFLGLPFNIASYSLLTYLVGRVTNRTPRNLIMSLGDTHLYDNHREAAALQLTRSALPPPKLDLSNAPYTSIDAIKPEHIVLRDYKSHETIKAEIAV